PGRTLVGGLVFEYGSKLSIAFLKTSSACLWTSFVSVGAPAATETKATPSAVQILRWCFITNSQSNSAQQNISKNSRKSEPKLCAHDQFERGTKNLRKRRRQ